MTRYPVQIEQFQTLARAAAAAVYFVFLPVHGAGISAAVQAQEQLLRQNAQQEKSLANAKAIQRQIYDKVINLTFRVYTESKTSGLRIVNPTRLFEDINSERRLLGMWPTEVGEKRDVDNFLVLVDPVSRVREVLFGIQGFGAVTVHTEIRDIEFEQTGRFSSDCSIKIEIADQSSEYACLPFTRGMLDKAISSDLSTNLAAAVQKRTKLAR